MNQKRLIIFIPTIEDGGVEKNLYIISDYLNVLVWPPSITKVAPVEKDFSELKK